MSFNPLADFKLAYNKDQLKSIYIFYLSY